MARQTPNAGLYVWDLETDDFDHIQLAANWDAIDSLLYNPTNQVETLSSLPSTGNFAGRLVMLSATNGGFPAWTLVRYDGSAWRPVSAMEIQPTVPSTGNFAGRIVILSAANGGFDAWSIIRYDGSAWGLVGGWASINTGSGATNIKGLQTPTDVYISDSARGLVIKDRNSGLTYRLFMNAGIVEYEQVT